MQRGSTILVLAIAVVIAAVISYGYFHSALEPRIENAPIISTFPDSAVTPVTALTVPPEKKAVDASLGLVESGLIEPETPDRFEDLLAAADGNPEAIVISQDLMNTFALGDITEHFFLEFQDALLLKGGGQLHSDDYRALLTESMKEYEGALTLSSITCSENICAAAIWGYETDTLNAHRSALFPRMWENEALPKMHVAYSQDFHQPSGTERRIVWATGPIVRGAMLNVPPGTPLPDIPDAASEADPGG